MEETRFKTDHSQHGNDKKGDYAFMRPKLILFVLIYRKKKKEVLPVVKVSFQFDRVSAV